jgi:dTDP-4-dehydrorhamnose reductase
MKIHKALVLGSDGQVGTILSKTFPRSKVVKSDRNPNTKAVKYDIIEILSGYSRFESLLVKHAPEVVFITAGMTWVDGCEKDPTTAYCVNRDAPAAIVKVCKDFGVRTVFYSTEYVFDGNSGPYTEDSIPNPISVYGKSKLEGEQLIQSIDDTSLIIRTTVVYGPDPHRKNFAYQMHKVASSTKMKPVFVPVDQISSPTYNRDLAKISILLVENNMSGIVNVAGPERMNRVAFARKLVKHLHGDPDIIKPIKTKELKQVAARPLNAGLDISFLKKFFMKKHRMRNVDEAAAHWIKSRGNLKWKPIKK